jgi:hypothetical protein
MLRCWWSRLRWIILGCGLAAVYACTPFKEPLLDAGADSHPSGDAGEAGGSSTQADAALDAGSAPDADADDATKSDGPGDSAASCSSAATRLRLIAPLSTSFVSTLRPTLRWEGSDKCATTVELCSDSSCGDVIQTLSPARGTFSARPPSDLPRGVVFWRARSGSEATPTWSFFVEKATAVDGSGGTYADFNGDGRSDVAVLADSGAVLVYYGSVSGLQEPPEALKVPLSGSAAEGSLAAVGDLTGDGYGDLVVVAPSSDTDTRARLYILEGSTKGMTPFPGAPFFIETFAKNVLPVVRGGLDVNADGYGDFIVATENQFVPVFGQGVDVVIGKELDLPGQRQWAPGTFAVCDANGDGKGDLVALVRTSNGPAPALLLGDGSTFTWDGNERPSHGSDSESFVYVACADVQGDGYPEIIAGAPHSSVRDPGAGDLLIYENRAGSISTVERSPAGVRNGAQTYLPSALATVGDMNGDGTDELLIGLNTLFEVSQLSFAALSGAASDVISIGGTPETQGYFGAAFGTGDFDGDGLADVIVSSPGYGKGRLTLFRGSRSARVLSPSKLHFDTPAAISGFGLTISASR